MTLSVRMRSLAWRHWRRSPRVELVFGAILLLASTAGVANATGYFIDQESASGLGRANAGDAAAAQDASTVFFNPAGMTELWRNAEGTGETLIQFGSHLIVPRSQLTNAGSTAITPGTGGFALGYAGGNASNPGNITPVANAYIVQRLFNGAAYVGFGITTPFGLSGEYSSSWFGRYDNLKATLLTANIGPVFAIPINSYISIGGGIDIQYQSSVLSSALPNPFMLGGPNTATDGHFDARGTAWAVGYNVGVLVKPTEGLRIGVHYRSAIDHTLKGTATTSAFTGLLAALNGSVGAKALSKLPDILTTGVVYQIDPQLAVFGEYSWYGWGRVGSARIQLANGAPDLVRAGQFRDTFAVGVGLEYALNDRLTLRGGFKYDRTPTEDAFRDTAFADANRYWFTAGATYRLTKSLSLDFAVAQVFESGAQVNVTRTFYDGTPLASAVNVRANVRSNVTTIASALNYRF